jgi:HAE1 family hydrophobic/amphiphilic exporter-1
MTSFAFILGCVPLWIAAGAGAASRRILGTAVIAGMSMVTALGVFIVPVLYVVVEKLTGGKKGGAQPAAAAAHGGGATAVAKGEHP